MGVSTKNIAQTLQYGLSGQRMGYFYKMCIRDRVLAEAHKIGLGAQFGGKYLAHDVRIIRLPRHGASLSLIHIF